MPVEKIKESEVDQKIKALQEEIYNLRYSKIPPDKRHFVMEICACRDCWGRHNWQLIFSKDEGFKNDISLLEARECKFAKCTCCGHQDDVLEGARR